MNSEELFTKAREAYPKADRIEVKYLTMTADGAVDDGLSDWAYVVSYLGDYLDYQARVTEVAIAHLPCGTVRFVYGDDVTDEAVQAIWEAERVEDADPYAEHRLGAAHLGIKRVA